MDKILEKDLSYKIVGILIEISKKYGNLYKEEFYHNACKEILERQQINFLSQPRINIYSMDSGKKLAIYNPDFLVNEKIILEIKAIPFLSIPAITQLDQYLKASKYEIGYIVNFGSPKAEIKRRIYTNDRKSFLNNQ